MKTKLTMMVAAAMACVAVQLAAMPTEEETKQAEPVVKKMLAQERAALESGKKTRSEVAAAAMKLADEADTDAAKLLLMKGAFALYVKDGNLEKAVETMNALETAIADMPPQSVTNMIEMALLGVAKKVDGARLYKLIDETKADVPSYSDLPSHVESKAIAASVKERSSVASILKGMIKVPGRDFWLSATELTQGQWESVMGYNLSQSKGVNLPVENVSRYDCDVFFERLNQTKEVQASQFEFRLPSNEEWECAARAGHLGACWIKPGVVGDILDMAWIKENSSNQLHAVATKAPNAFGFYDMLGNAWEWIAELDGRGRGIRRGLSCYDENHGMNYRWYTPRQNRWPGIGLRLAAHIRSGSVAGNVGKAGSKDEAEQRQATVDGYTWSYRVKNGEAMIVTTNGRCAVSPSPKGDVSIPSTLDGVKVTSIGNNAFRNCRGLTSVTIPADVTSIGGSAFHSCSELSAVMIPSSIRNIGEWAFANCYALKSMTIPSNMESVGGGAFHNCRGLTSVTIPAKVTSIGGAAFSYCNALRQINVNTANQTFTSIDGVLYTKDQSVLLACPNALTSVKIPKGVTHIGVWAFEGCNGLMSVTIPEGVTSIEGGAFKECGGLESVVMPSGLKKIGWGAFDNCRSLKSVTIPEGVCDIGGSAFLGCGELTSLTLPKGLVRIGPNAFRGMGKLMSVTIPESVTSIGGSVFSYCGGLTQINVEAKNQKYTSVDGVLYTKDMTELVMCPNGLTSVTIPESVTSIGPGAFIGCSKLTSAMLPSGVSHIGEWAFEACNGLTSVTIPESVTRIDQWAFQNCGGLTSMTMRCERPEAPNSIFQGCGKLKSIHVPANAKSWAGMKDWHGIPLVFDGQSGADLVDAPAQGMNVAANKLQSCDFLLNKGFKKNAKYYLCLFSASWCGPCRAEMPRIAKTYAESLKDDPSIELIHFSWDQNAEKALAWAKEHDVKFPVVKPNGGNPLDLHTRGIPHLFIVKADGTLVEEGHPMKLFTDEKLRELKSERGVSDVTYTDNVGCTWRYADNNDGSLTITGASLQAPSPVTIPTSLNGKNVTRIGKEAFRGNAMITGVTIPGSIVGIEDFAFYGCPNLADLTILDGVTRIDGLDAFRYCEALTTITFPKSLKYIRNRALRNCPNVIRLNVASIEDWLSIRFVTPTSNPMCMSGASLYVNGNKITGEVVIPNGVRQINDYAFMGCDGMLSVIIPGSVESIGQSAFMYNEGAKGDGGARQVIRISSDIGTIRVGPLVCDKDTSVEIMTRSECSFVGWEDDKGNLVEDPFHSNQWNTVKPRWNTKGAFALNAAPGSVTELGLESATPLQFVYCPPGKFTMGYKEQPAISKVKDVEITSPFWVSKTLMRADQLELLGLNSITNAETGDAVINDGSIVLEKLPSALKERFGKMLPPGYVFRLPTEAEFEYLQKAETKGGDGQTNIWGVERLYSGGYIGLLDRAPAYGRVDVVRRRNHRGVIMTDLVKVNYENQPDKDPVGWTDDPTWSVFRRGLARNCGGGKLVTAPGGGKYHYSFYFVVAPDIDKLNKFYWK